MPLRFRLLPDPYAVVRLEPGAEFPLPADGERFISVTRTSEELSIVCREAIAPEGGRSERGWRVLALEGPIPFDQTGVAAAFTTALAIQEIGVFVVSTFDTDYLLVKNEDLDGAREALRADGIEVRVEGSGVGGLGSGVGDQGSGVGDQGPFLPSQVEMQNAECRIQNVKRHEVPVS